MAEIFQTSLSGTFNSGVTPREVTGITVSCYPSMGNTFYINLHSSVTGRTLYVTSSVNWLHIRVAFTYTKDEYTSYLCEYIQDYNPSVTSRSGDILISAVPDLSINTTAWTVQQLGIYPHLMSETELDNYLVAILESQILP